MPELTWDYVDQAVDAALKDGWLADYRTLLKVHPTKRFRKRVAPTDILGCCTHHSASPNQNPRNTAAYHVGPNHVSATGCPGILYTFVISQAIEEDKVLLCNDLQSATWSQAKKDPGNKPEWSGDENRHLVSVLCMGDFNEEGRPGKSGEPTASQFDRWKKVTSWLQNVFGFDGMGFFGHHHFGKAFCPGQTLRRLVACRRMGFKGLDTDGDWQEALLRWNPNCLPKYGADGFWGNESRRALIEFERQHKHRADGVQDPFSELLLCKRYPSD